MTVRAMSPDAPDFRRMVEWFARDEVREWYGGESHRYSYDEVAAIYGPRCADESAVRANIIEWRERPIGYLQYYPVEEPEEDELQTWQVDFWALDIFIGEPKLWGRGIGTTATALVQRYLHDQYGVTDLVIDPRLENLRAIRAYEKVGFRPVQLLREHEEHDGVLCDCLLMRWRAHWPPRSQVSPDG